MGVLGAVEMRTERLETWRVITGTTWSTVVVSVPLEDAPREVL
jgi:hypothetical protein